MFGMALKFFEMNLQPQKILRNSDVSSKQRNDENAENYGAKKLAKSTQDIKSYLNGQPLKDLKLDDNLPFRDQMIKKNELKSSRIKTTNFSSQVTMEQLKQTQQKVLQDFKRSISKSLASSSQSLPNLQESDQKVYSSAVDSSPKYERLGGLVLSKIQQLSEEYLEYSMRKQDFINQNSKIVDSNPDTFTVNNVQNNKAVSCQLIKSIVKSVLFESQQQEQPPIDSQNLRQSPTKKSLSIFDDHINCQTYESSSGESFQVRQNVSEFIKDLLSSLGLITESERQSNSIRSLTKSAKKNFNQLKGNDYVEKLQEMLQSVQNIDKSHQHSTGNQSIKLGESQKFHSLQTGKQNIFSINSSSSHNKFTDSPSDKSLKSRKQILIKREQDKKVKLVSPQTCSELQNRRSLIEKQISDAVEFLTKVRRARKFAFDSTKINEVYLSFSMDFKFMSYKHVSHGFFSQVNLNKVIKQLCSCTKPLFPENWSKQQAQQHQQVALEGRQPQQSKVTILSLPWNLVNISKGIKTKNFIKYQQILNSDENNREEPLHEERCLSFLFKNRTYDFEFESKQVRDEYFRAVKIMIKSSFDL